MFNNICTTFRALEALMVDGGPEFDNNVVCEACVVHNVELQIVPGYSPWINGLMEGMNAKLLGRLKRLCSPDLVEDKYNVMDLPTLWPDHLEEAIEFLNNCILPNLKFSPNELLLGIVINTKHTPANQAEEEVLTHEVEVQMAYVEQQWCGYAHTLSHAHKWKLIFDRKLLSWAPKEVIFKAGQLVQVYQSHSDFTFKAERKMEPKWSAPWRITSRDWNSYKLETLEGLPIGNRFSSWQLWRFIPCSGTALHAAQEAIEKLWGKQEAKEDKVIDKEEGIIIDNDRNETWEDINWPWLLINTGHIQSPTSFVYIWELSFDHFFIFPCLPHNYVICIHTARFNQPYVAHRMDCFNLHFLGSSHPCLHGMETLSCFWITSRNPWHWANRASQVCWPRAG
jgi:hypothetical protein